MTRISLINATMAVVLSAVMLPSTRADELSDPFGGTLETPPLSVPAPLAYEEPIAQPVSNRAPVMPQSAIYRPASDLAQQPGPMPINGDAYATAPQYPVQQPGYVRLGAPLYPSPRPNIPIWSGSTMITNPAFAPHEMLYPHTYRSMSGPYYHRVTGGWIWTPFGIRSHERWELQGTQVEVKYRSHVPLLTRGMWFPPVTSK